MTAPENLIDGVGELFPCALLPLEHGSALGGEAIEPPPPFDRLLRPSSADEAAGFESTQDRVQRSDSEGQTPVRSRFDESADLVAVARPMFEQRQDQQLGAAFFQLVV